MLIGYVRVLIESQHVDLQKDALHKAGCERISEDIISGAKKERQGLDTTLAHLREGDTLAVWKLNHLGRSMAHLVNTVQGLATCSVGLKVLAGQDTAIDTTTAPDRLAFGTSATLAKFERDLIRERIKAGSVAATVHGCKNERKPVVTTDKLQRAREHIANGLNIREAATRLKVNKMALYAVL